jgi:CRISPR-associated protein Csm2
MDKNNNRGHNSQSNFQPERNWDKEFKQEWITTGITKEGIKFTEDFGKFLKNNQLTTNQIRNIFGEIKRIQMSGIEKRTNKTAFLLLKPKMAYAVARDGSKGLKQLTKVIDKAFDSVELENKEKVEEQFQNFVDFFEAILAYHKAEGGR